MTIGLLYHAIIWARLDEILGPDLEVGNPAMAGGLVLDDLKDPSGLSHSMIPHKTQRIQMKTSKREYSPSLPWPTCSHNIYAQSVSALCFLLISVVGKG